MIKYTKGPENIFGEKITYYMREIPTTYESTIHSNYICDDNDPIDRIILAYTGTKGYTVAHSHVLNRGWMTNNPEILSLRAPCGYSVAHAQAAWGSWTTDNIDILKMKDRHGYSVAHYIVMNHSNWKPENEEILKLTTNRGNTVAEFIEDRNFEQLTKRTIITVTVIVSKVEGDAEKYLVEFENDGKYTKVILDYMTMMEICQYDENGKYEINPEDIKYLHCDSSVHAWEDKGYHARVVLEAVKKRLTKNIEILKKLQPVE